MKTKVLFLIHDLGQGGAEKVLVNLVNHMDQSRFDITVMSIFNIGENRSFLSPDIKYKYFSNHMFRGHTHIMKAFSPDKLHKLIIKDHYDIEVAYLEGPCARIISGCSDRTVKKVAWIHRQLDSSKMAAASFRSIPEAETCYNSFDQIVGVSYNVIDYFSKSIKIDVPMTVLYNTNESDKIRSLALEKVEIPACAKNKFHIIGVGKLIPDKGFLRLVKIVKKLKSSGIEVYLDLLGEGRERKNIETYVIDNELKDNVRLLGYQINPYKYMARADLFVCSSYGEGFSTATTEALILGIPVCTVDVSGMKEMLGENNEYGIITDNNEDALYIGMYMLLSDAEQLEKYKQKARIRGNMFDLHSTVAAVENMLIKL